MRHRLFTLLLLLVASALALTTRHYALLAKAETEQLKEDNEDEPDEPAGPLDSYARPDRGMRFTRVDWL